MKGKSAPKPPRVSGENALYQQWLALKDNRQKRHRLGQFLVEGTTAIDAAVEYGWEIEEMIYPAGASLSSWARTHLASGLARRTVEMAPALLGRLTERREGTELLAIARCRLAELESLEAQQLVVVLDRPKSSGNLGSIVRTACSFGADALVVSGHAADPFDPACVRASVGTLFSLPIACVSSHAPLLAWVAARRQQRALRIIGTGHRAPDRIDRVDLRGDVVLVLGNETHGLSRAYQDACDLFVRLPTLERQSSLNVSAAAAVALYELRRQRSSAET